MNINTKMYAYVFGIAFVVAGVLGFVPYVVMDGYLFGLFMVGTVHNIIHLVTGAVALYVTTKVEYAKLFFKVFGVIYAVVAFVGFVNGGDVYVMHVNAADNYLHVVVALVALYVGFVKKEE